MKTLLVLLTSLISINSFAEGGGSSVGPANPASVNCVTLGGVIELVQAPNGQYGNCVIDEWKLYREMYVRGLIKTHRYGPGGMPNPAAVNCIEVPGEIRIVETREGQAGYCVVEEWTLFRVIDVVSRR